MGIPVARVASFGVPEKDYLNKRIKLGLTFLLIHSIFYKSSDNSFRRRGLTEGRLCRSIPSLCEKCQDRHADAAVSAH